MKRLSLLALLGIFLAGQLQYTFAQKKDTIIIDGAKVKTRLSKARHEPLPRLF